MSKKNRDCPYVLKSECAITTVAMKQDLADIKSDLHLVKTTLVGEDMRGGLVSDVAEMKKSRSMTVEVLKVLIPLAAVILAFALGKLWP